MSSCRPGGASEEANILNQRENIAQIADAEPERSMGWCLRSASSHVLILVNDTVAGHASVAGGQGHLLHPGDVVGTGEAAQVLTAKGKGARFARWHVILW